MNRKISDWASVAEIIGTVAVVVSLVFVVRSIDQNTKAIEAAEANNIWQAWRETAQLPVINNADFAAINSKVLNSQPLTDVEQIRWDKHMSAQIDIWAQLFDLQRNDLISQELWKYWDDGFVQDWGAGHESIWQRIRGAYDPDFQAHVESNTQQMGKEP
jgi:hypothetical protein